MSSNKAQLVHVPVNNIIERQDALRTHNPKDEDYLRVRDSVKAEGVLNSISLVPATMPDGSTPKTNPDSGEPIYVLIDGLQRLTACRDLGIETIPAQIFNKNEASLLAAQFMANAVRVETKPAEYTAFLKRTLAADTTLTKAELATRLCVSVDFINKRLSLGGLIPQAQKLVDSGDIVLSNAYELAKLKDPEEQAAYLEAAMQEPPATFGPTIQNRVKAIREANRAGRDPEADRQFEAVPHLRKLSEMKDAYDEGNFGPVRKSIEQAGITDPVDAAIFMLKWTLRLDDESVDYYREQWEAREAKKKQEQVERAAERAAKRAAELEAAKVALQQAGNA